MVQGDQKSKGLRVSRDRGPPHVNRTCLRSGVSKIQSLQGPRDQGFFRAPRSKGYRDKGLLGPRKSKGFKGSKGIKGLSKP